MNKLKNLLRLNTNIKIKLEENNLKIFYKGMLIKTVILLNNLIEDNEDLIYNSIVSLENITLYIPKIYIREI